MTLFRTGSRARSAVVTAVVLAVCGLVGLTASGVGLVAAPVWLGGSWPFAIRTGGAVAALMGIAYLVVQRKRFRPVDDRAPDPTAAALSTAATIMGVLVLVALLAPRMATMEEQTSRTRSSPVEGDSTNGSSAGSAGLLPQAGAGGGGAGASGRSRGGSAEDRIDRSNPQNGGGEAGRGVLARLGNALLIAVLVAIGVLGFLIMRGRSDAGEAHDWSTRRVAAADAEAGLEASLGEVAYDGDDPRAQITAAYHRLLFALAAVGAPREPQEAPYEYLARVLGPLGVRREPVHRLTELYVVAQFSEHPVDEQHRILAVAALEEGLSNLRAMRDRTESSAGVAA